MAAKIIVLCFAMPIHCKDFTEAHRTSGDGLEESTLSERENKKGNHLHVCVSITKCDDSIYVIKFKFEFKSFQNFPLFFFFKDEQRREAITKKKCLITRQDNSISSREGDGR